MKPLELTVYDRNDDGDYLDSCTPNGRQFVIALEDVEVYSMHKRLTDAELAAEVHSQREVWAVALYDDVYARYVDDEGELTSMRERFLMGEKAKALHRFATLPHYDEESK